MRTITLDDIKQAAATLDPTATNEGACKYTRHDGGHCMVGQILTELGSPVPTYRSKYNSTSVGDLWHKFLIRYDISLTEDAADYLTAAQEAADMNDQWGIALENAEASV